MTEEEKEEKIQKNHLRLMKFFSTLFSRTSFLFFGFFLAAGATAVLAAIWVPVEKKPLDPLTSEEWNTIAYNASGWQRAGDMDLPTQNIFTNLSGGVGIGNNIISENLKLDVEGSIGAMEYCDENGKNCLLAAELANGGGLNGITCQNGQILQYNGTAWVCANNSGGDGGDTLWTAVNGGVALPTGVVAIGHDTPDAELHIMPNTTLTSDLDSDIRLGDEQGWALSGMKSDAGIAINGYDIRRFSIQDFTGEKFVINHNGNVGIGTNAPTSALQVVGIQEYADNAAATAAGLTAGALYRTGDILKIVH